MVVGLTRYDPKSPYGMRPVCTVGAGGPKFPPYPTLPSSPVTLSSAAEE